jgi:hypothetical protein
MASLTIVGRNAVTVKAILANGMSQASWNLLNGPQIPPVYVERISNDVHLNMW